MSKRVVAPSRLSACYERWFGACTMRTVAECSADIDEKNSRFELINETRLNENPPEGGFSFVILTNLTLNR